MLLKTYLHIAGIPSLKEYSSFRRYALGFVGLVKGLYFYYKNKRISKIDTYVSYFIVREITGDKNL